MVWPGSPDPHWKCRFISVLACAQQFGIDFLGIAWQEGFGSLGRGAQSTIFQADTSVKDRFAFKTSSPYHRTGAYRDFSGIFHELLVQIMIHGHPALRAHPNILTLEAIGWDLEDPTKRETNVWPVLIFEKTTLENLRGFVVSDTPRAGLDMNDRLGLCADVASALAALHTHDAVHLDLKPDNILIFPGSENEPKYVAKLADFGLSEVVWGDRTVQLRRADIWSAPENESGKKCSAAEAKKVDIYMFALTCVWALFYEQLRELEKHENNERVLREYRTLLNSNGGVSTERTGLLALKNAGSDAVLAFAKIAIATLSGPHARACSFLIEALIPDPNARLHSLEGIELFTWRDNPLEIETHIETPSEFTLSSVLQIPQALTMLCRVDFRVRKHIVSSLVALVKKENEDDEIRTDAALQVVFCKLIGFGGPINDSTAEAWLKKVKPDAPDVDAKIELIKSSKIVRGYDFKNKRLQDMYADGVITPIQTANEFLELKDYGIAERHLRKEIETMGSALGKTHVAVLNLRWGLETVLMATPPAPGKQPMKLIDHLEGIASDMKEDSDLKNSIECTMIQMDLAMIQMLTGGVKGLEDGGKLAMECHKTLMRERGENHILTCLSAASIAKLLKTDFKTVQAKHYFDLAVNGLETTFGPEHTRTIELRDDRAFTSLRLGMYDEAETELREILKVMEKLEGKDDPRTLTCRMKIQTTLTAAGKLKDAEDEARALLKSLEAIAQGGKVPGHRQIPPQMVTDSLGYLLLAQGRYEEAEAEFAKLRPWTPWLSRWLVWLRRPPPTDETLPRQAPQLQTPVVSDQQDNAAPLPEDFPYNFMLVMLLIRHSIAIQARAHLGGDMYSMNESYKDFRVVMRAVSQVLSKESWPQLDPANGIKGSALHHAMTMGWAGNLEVLVNLGGRNKLTGLHYKEAIRLAKEEGLDEAAVILEEHQLICYNAPVDSQYSGSMDTLLELLNGTWEGCYLWNDPPGPRRNRNKSRVMDLTAKVMANKPGSLAIHGTGEDEAGQVKIEGEVTSSGCLVMAVGLGDGEIDIGWQYKGTVNLSRRAMGGTWAFRNSTMPLGTFYMFSV
ncbi:kinase-like protein [Cenococcum geophilum]